MTDYLLRFDHINFHYGQEDPFLIHDVTFEVSPGDRLVIKGESGTGKTTLFRLLLGFEQPDNGAIWFKGKNLEPPVIQQLRKQTAWLPQDLDLGSETLEEIFIFLFDFETNKTQEPQRDTVDAALQSLGLDTAVWGKNFSDLSTGQRQRAGVALCYLLNKPLILLDEPTSALDPASKQKVADLIFKDPQRTIISTSHDPFWIKRCKKIIDLD